MIRLTIQDLFSQLNQVAQNMEEAAGTDSFISQADYRKKRSTLVGAQQLLFDAFFVFLKSLEESEQGRITLKDVEKGIAFFQDQILAQFELLPQDLTDSESVYIGGIHQSAAPLAAQIKRAMIEEAEYADSQKLFEQLQALEDELIFDFLGSEAGLDVKATLIEANISGPLTVENVSNALGLDQSNPVDFFQIFEDATDFLLHFVDNHRSWGREQAAVDMARLMEDHLMFITVIVVGEDNHPAVNSEHPVYVIGLAEDGNLVGIQSHVIWT